MSGLRLYWFLSTSFFILCVSTRLIAAEGDPFTAVRVSDNGTHFETQSGTPFFWMGDTVWNGPLLANDDEWETFLNDRVSKKFSVIQFVMAAPWRTAPTDAEGQTAYTGSNPIQIQEKFFARMDRRMEAIKKHGLVAAPVLLWTLGDKNQSPGQLPEADAIKLANFVVDRYQSQPLCWILPGDGRYEGDHAERWKRIGRAVFGNREKHAPVTLHPQGMYWPFENFREENWIGYYGYQSGHGDDANTLKWIHSGPVVAAAAKKPVRPIINLEPPYEDHLAYQSRKPHSAYNVRRACYWSCLVTPTCGVTYGAHGIWSWQEKAGTPLNHGGSGTAKPWKEAKDLPGAAQMGHLVSCFEKVKWWDLRPDPALLSDQPGTKDPAKFIAASSTPQRKEAIIYLPVGGTVKLTTVWQTAEWFDPRTGKTEGAQVNEAGVYTAADSQDWALILHNAVLRQR